MIEYAILENVVTGATVQFNDDNVPFHLFNTEIDVRNEDRERPLEHGMYPTYTYYGMRRFHCEGDLIGDSSSDYIERRRAIYRALYIPRRLGIREPYRLRMYFTGMDEEVQSLCTLDTVELPMSVDKPPGIGEYMITLKSFDPVMYGGQSLTARAGSPQAPTPVNWVGTAPIAFPVSFTGANAGGDIILTNSGDIDTYPVWTIAGNATSPELIFIDGSDRPPRLRLDGLQVPPSTTVTVDFKTKTARASDGTNVFSFVHDDSVWWSIPPGESLVRYSAFFAGVGSNAIAAWRNAYML